MNDKIAIITGASKGIGMAIASRFARNGYRVINIGLGAQPEGVSWEHVDADLMTADGRAIALDAIYRLPHIDVLINNAGIAKANRIEDTVWSDAKDMMELNYFATFFLIKYCVPFLRKANGGVILNITSISGLTGFTTMGAYCASKFAVTGLSLSAAKELARYNIRVNCICPGPTNTDMWTGLDVDYKKINGWETETESEQAYMSKLLIKRLGHPDDIADAAEFLASDRASYITGINFKVCGGNMIG